MGSLYVAYLIDVFYWAYLLLSLATLNYQVIFGFFFVYLKNRLISFGFVDEYILKK
jgi:hypothetical protein